MVSLFGGGSGTVVEGRATGSEKYRKQGLLLVTITGVNRKGVGA